MTLPKDPTQLTNDEIADLLSDGIASDVAGYGGEFNINDEERAITEFKIRVLEEAAKRLRGDK